jgi:hypothetical protein
MSFFCAAAWAITKTSRKIVKRPSAPPQAIENTGLIDYSSSCFAGPRKILKTRGQPEERKKFPDCLELLHLHRKISQHCLGKFRQSLAEILNERPYL